MKHIASATKCPGCPTDIRDKSAGMLAPYEVKKAEKATYKRMEEAHKRKGKGKRKLPLGDTSDRQHLEIETTEGGEDIEVVSGARSGSGIMSS